jgi:hypothetical protein
LKTTDKKPPENARRVWRVADLPPARETAWYGITNGTQPETAHMLAKRRRQVMELLMAGPVYCASPVRVSDIVHVLKQENGLEVETEYYPGDPETGAGNYGVYFLKSRVRRLERQKVAA